jgi:hypothetical protein
MDEFSDQKTSIAPRVDRSWVNAVLGFTALYLIGWWLLLSNNALQFTFLGLPLRVWLVFVFALHLATIFISTLFLYLNRSKLRGFCLVSFFISLTLSGILMVALVKLEPSAPPEFEVEPDAGFSAGYRL